MSLVTEASRDEPGNSGAPMSPAKEPRRMVDKAMGPKTLRGMLLEMRDIDADWYRLVNEQVAEVLGALTERERSVLELRFGFQDGRKRTLEEVGRAFGVTRERIRHIQMNAIRKLGQPSGGNVLRNLRE